MRFTSEKYRSVVILVYFFLNFLTSGFLIETRGQVAQEWVQRYSGLDNSDDVSKSLAVDNFGNVFVTGVSENDYCTIKYNSAGVQQWKTTYNGPSNSVDEAIYIVADGSGNVYVTGSSESDYCTIKYNSFGIQQWVQRYNGPGNGYDAPSSMTIDNMGNIFLTGRVYDGSVKMGTVKYNSFGIQEWVQLNGPTYHLSPKSYVRADNFGNVYVAGNKNIGGLNLVLTKYNTAGIQQWEQSYNGPGNNAEFASSLVIDEFGNIYVTGSSVGSGSNYDFVTIKYNSSGVQQWVQRYNGPGNNFDEPRSISLDISGNIIVTGTSIGNGSEFDIATIKYNSSGIQQWVRRYNGSGNSNDGANSIAVDNTGNIIVTGYCTLDDLGVDYITIKYNSSGVQQWQQIYNGTGNAYDNSAAIALDNFNNIFITGSSPGIASGNDYATLKYSQYCQPTLLNPPNDTTINSSQLNFQWSDCNADHYELLVDNDSAFGSPEISRYNIDTLENYTNTSFQISGWLEEKTYYWKVSAVYPGGSKVESSSGTFTYSPVRTTTPTWTPIYRAYKPADVDHFYCTSESHLAQAVRDGYNFEKVDGYLSSTPFVSSSMKNIFRFYIDKQKSHIYTSNSVTKDSLISADTTNLYEGITGFAYGTFQSGMAKFFYALKNDTNQSQIDHFYTISDVEKNNALHNGYADRGFIAYVSVNGDEDTEPWMEMQPEVGYGINPQNGNVGAYNKTSFNIPGARTSLSFMHIYNSYTTRLMSQINSIGAGWSHTYMATLSTVGDKIYVKWPGGGVHVYKSSDLKPVTKGVYDVLTKISSTRYNIKKKDQFVYTFDILPTTQDSTAFMTSIKDRNNNTILINYDPSPNYRRITSVSSPEGRYLTFTYYSSPGKTNLIFEIIDPAGRRIKFEYDNDNNLTKFTDAKSQITQYQYLDTARQDHLLSKIILPKGNSIENNYLGKRIVSQKKANTSFNMTLEYSPLSTVVRELGHDFTYYYSSPSQGLLTSLTRGSIKDSIVYNDNLNPTKPTKIFDGRGNITTMSYDIQGNVLQVNKPENAVHKFFYNSFNDVTQYTDPRNKITTYGYNGTGNLTSVINPRGSTNISYNLNGTINTITDPLNRVKTLGYNGFGNVSSVTDNMNHQTYYAYDNISRLISMTDANGRITNYTNDNNDLLTLVSKPYSTNTNYTYDLNDNLNSISNPNNNVTTLNHNTKDLLQNIINPLSNQVSYEYNDDGTLKQKTLPNNQTISYSYDNLNRLQTISGATIGNIIYDNSDNIISANNSIGTISYTYDGLNRITSHSDYYGNTVSYTYDLSGNILSVTYPGNKVVEYTYYDDNLLHTVKDWNNNVTSYLYRNDGSIQEVLYPNGTKKTYTYDAAGRVMGISNTKSNGSIICQYNFTLDNVGNHLSVTQTEPYSTLSLSSASRNFTYNAANRVTAEGGNVYSYSPNGNLLQKLGIDTINYTFDANNRLTTMNGKHTASFNYDLYGNRRSSNISGIARKYVLDVNSSMPKVIMETDSNGVVINYYIYGLELISRLKPNGTTSYFHSDYRGSIVAITKSDEAVTHKYSYDPFGNILSRNEADSNPFKYVGAYGVMDDENGLYFMRARYYDPKLGRFISEDQVWDVNLYAYGDNNPIIYIDPNGTNFIDPIISNVKNRIKATKEKIKGLINSKDGTEYMVPLLSLNPDGVTLPWYLKPFYNELKRPQQEELYSKIENSAENIREHNKAIEEELEK